jgi:cell wall-associated NlpC family hydrolase
MKKSKKSIYILFLTILMLIGCTSVKKGDQSGKGKKGKVIRIVTAPDGPDDSFISEGGFDRKILLKVVEQWIGTPYKYGGSSKSGVDCSGLVWQVFNEAFGINLKRSSIEILTMVKIIKEESLSPGDLVFFKTSDKEVNHVGIYLGERRFVHSSTSRGVIISGLDEPYYKKHYMGAGRIKQ